MPLIKDFSVQLYSLRDETAKDFYGVLKKLAGIGYTGVEFAGYGSVPAGEMKKMLNELGLFAVGSHIAPDKLRDRLEAELEYNHIID